MLRYVRPEFKEGKFNVASMATTTIFYASCFQYLMLAFALSKGPPYRRRIWTNGIFQLYCCHRQKYVFEFVDIDRMSRMTDDWRVTGPQWCSTQVRQCTRVRLQYLFWGLYSDSSPWTRTRTWTRTKFTRLHHCLLLTARKPSFYHIFMEIYESCFGMDWFFP